MDRIMIEISGNLPDEDKFAILAAAQKSANEMAAELTAAHGLELTVSVRPVRVGKKGVAMPEPVASAEDAAGK